MRFGFMWNSTSGKCESSDVYENDDKKTTL